MVTRPGSRKSGGGGRAQRADAQANRARVLDAAEDVFAEGGEASSTEEVARRAGVGIGTVFRHFPTKTALLEAVLVRRFDRLRDRAEALLEANEPGQAFFDFFGELVTDAPTKIALGEAFRDVGGDPDGGAALASNRLRRAVGALLQRAQHAGAIRDDVDLPEVYALLIGTSRAVAHSPLPAKTTRRMLAIVFDGLTPH